MTYHVPRTPNYRLNSDLVVQQGYHSNKVLPSGSYVRPLELHYVPQHVLDKYLGFDNKQHVFCYTHFGIIPIARYLLRET